MTDPWAEYDAEEWSDRDRSGVIPNLYEMVERCRDKATRQQHEREAYLHDIIRRVRSTHPRHPR